MDETEQYELLRRPFSRLEEINRSNLINGECTAPEIVALFKACLPPKPTSLLLAKQQSALALVVPGFAVAPASSLRHYPLVAPRAHRMPLIRSRSRFFRETASISGNTSAVAVHADRSVAEAPRIRQSGDHRSPQTGSMEIRGGHQEATPRTEQPASFRKSRFVLG